MNTNWSQSQNNYYPGDSTNQFKNLPVGIYKVEVDPQRGLYLSQIMDKFSFPYKIYGIETKFVDRVIKTYKNTKGNLGILLNGIKGTGKTVTAELISNELQLPVILINADYSNGSGSDPLVSFINDIQQDIVLLFDEYEKIYENSSFTMLSIMDGVMSNGFRKTFLLTTNQSWINENMLSRPSRIRYVKQFGDLSIESIIEIIDDKLKYTKFKDEIIRYISGLSIITVDIVKSVVEEVNIHNESPEEFKDIMNAKVNDERIDITDITNLIANKKNAKPEIIYQDIYIEPKIDQLRKGNDIYVNNGEEILGTIMNINNNIFTVRKTTFDHGTKKNKIAIHTFKLEPSKSTHSSFSQYIF